MDQEMLKNRVNLLEARMAMLENGQTQSGNDTISAAEINYPQVNRAVRKIMELLGEEELHVSQVHEVLRIVESRLKMIRIPKGG